MRADLLDLAFGSSCLGCATPGPLLCGPCAAGLPDRPRPARPTPCPEGLAQVWVAGEYAGVIRELVVAHKERRAFALAVPLGRLLAVACAAHLRQGEPPREPLLLVPVPSRWSVVGGRGHDPLLRLTRVAAARLRSAGVPAQVTRLLRPTGRVADQAGLDAAARQANLAGSMALRGEVQRALARAGKPVRVVLCDDVVTTGATVAEGQRALRDGGVPILGIAGIAATTKRLPICPPPG